MEETERVVAVISECVVKVVKQLLADYNTQLNDKLKHLSINGDQIKPLTIRGENIASGSISGGNIANGTISGDNIAPQTITGLNIVNGSIESAKINNLEAEVMNAVVANIASANIDWANIERLEAATAEVAKAEIGQAKIQSAQITDLNVSVGKIADAQIQHADIQFGQIKDFIGGTALITQGVAGEFYIEKLQVRQANMASLEAGQIVLRDADGILHELYVTDDGSVSTRIIEVNSNNIGDGVITGDKIAAGAVSDEQINAAAIFGNKGVVQELLVGVGTFGDIFANEAIVGQLRTHLINSDYLKILIEDTTSGLDDKIDSVAEQIMTPDQIVTTVRTDQRYNDDLQELRTAVTQNNNSWEVRISSAERDLSEVTDTANQMKTNLDTWYHFDADALTIGKTNSEYKTRQSNEKYEFLYNETPVASLSGDMFEAPKMHISDEFRFGGLCAVVDKTTGDIEWVWRGMPTAAAFSLR